MTLPSQKYLLENLLYERSVWFPDKGRAPYLAGLSRDVGFRCSFPLTLDSSDALSGQHRWYPTSRRKTSEIWGTRPWSGNQRFFVPNFNLRCVVTVMSTILTGVSLSNAAKRPLCTKGLRPKSRFIWGTILAAILPEWET